VKRECYSLILPKTGMCRQILVTLPDKISYKPFQWFSRVYMREMDTATLAVKFLQLFVGNAPKVLSSKQRLKKSYFRE